MQTLERQIIPPTIHLENQDPECDVVVVREATPVQGLDVVLNNALAFGGYDAALLLARPGKLGEFWH